MVTATPIGAKDTSSAERNAGAQGTVLDELRKLFVKAKLPSSPALASRILALADDPDTTIEQFAKVIQMDGALAARLLKMANSACIALVTPATTIQRAVMVLGLGRVRTAALGFQLVGHLNKLGGKKFNIKAYWQQSVLRGCVGREIAHVVAPASAEEAFLIGLLCDGGILLLVQLLGPEYAALYETGGLSPAAFFAAEKGRFPYDHADAIAAMAAEWNLPEAIQRPLAQHHFPTKLTAGAGPADRLCALAYLVGSLCFTEGLSPDSSADRLAAYAQEQLGLSPADLQKCLLAAGESYKQASELLGEALPDDLDVTDLLGEANRQLTAAAGEAEERVHDVETQRDQIKTALGEYRERAARDPLTGLLNRGALSDVAVKHLAAARAQSGAVSCFFLDLDNFKKLNDEYSHQTGDNVLKAVAAVLPRVIVNAGSIGRYGGEEMVVVIPALSAAESEAKALQIVEVVRGIDYVSLGLKARVTCSVGGIWGNPAQFESADTLFAAADEQMYIAKKSGKDRGVHRALGVGEQGTGNKGLGEAVGEAPSIPQSHNPTIPRRATAAPPNVESYRRIAEQLHRTAPPIYGDVRKRSRNLMLTPCFIRLLAGSKGATAAGVTIEESGYVRNFSTAGVGILTTRSMSRGDAVEVTICSPGKPPRTLAGVVAFCRHVEGNIHDIGIQFSA